MNKLGVLLFSLQNKYRARIELYNHKNELVICAEASFKYDDFHTPDISNEVLKFRKYK